MANLDYTGDAVAGAGIPNNFIAKSTSLVPLYRRLDVAGIIASDATMTTNGYITADDIIYAIHVPAGFLIYTCVARIITACTASVDIDVGLAGGDEGLATFSVDGTAGTCDYTASGDGFYGGYLFTSNDTIDVQFKTANCLVGVVDLYAIGMQLKWVAA